MIKLKMNMRIKSKPIVMIHHVPIITLFSTTLKVPPAHLFESEDPEPDESGLNEFDSTITTPARVTPFRNTAQ